MRVSINNFIAAINAPTKRLLSLRDIAPERNSCGDVVSKCTKHFVNVEITIRGERYLLSMPLSAEASAAVRRAAVRLKTLHSEHLTSYKILQKEISYIALSGLQFTDLLLQRIPDGYPLSTAVERIDKETLLDSVKQLEAEFKRLNLAHNNLKAENIIVDTKGRLIPLNYHYATTISEANHDNFEALGQWIEEHHSASTEKINPSNAENSPTKYSWIGSPFEGLCAVQGRDGYGFIDNQGVEIIPTQYIWVSDFKEGRAEVETPQGMGLIDRDGNEIIPPKYEIVDYDLDNNQILVRQDGLWAEFSYDGEQISDFKRLY